jgi:aspartyl-tRNA(Asn)/glutamyl-tRNA(Gln) amidotransferase subunit A
MNDLALISATELSALYCARKASPVEATKAVLAQIALLNPHINAFCWLDEDAALSAARASETRWRRGQQLSPLDGIPTTVKDLSFTRGWPTRRSCYAIEAKGPWLEDSCSVARMRDAGAVLLGKTTVPEFAAAFWTRSPMCGVTRNPWNLEKTPGGSSGGASASLAAGMGTIALGSDAAGSARTPASATSTFGLKSTMGRIPDYPSSYLGTLAVIGPMTRTVADAALCMNEITKPDSRDSYALAPNGIDYVKAIQGGVKGLRIAYSLTLGYAQVDGEVAKLVEAGVKLLGELGAEVEIVEKIFDDPIETLLTCMLPGVANAFRFFKFTDAQQALIGADVRESARKGAAISIVDYLAACDRREQLGALMRRFHERYDLLVTPVLAAPPIGAEESTSSDPRHKNITNMTPFTAAFNLTKQPAASVPVGLTSDGLPVGMQVVGPLYGDALVMRACHAIEQARAFPRPDLSRLLKLPRPEGIPRGIAAMNEAKVEMARA